MKRKSHSIFIPAAFIYVIAAIIFSLLFRDKMDEAMIALLLFALFPVVIIAWISDGLATGVLLKGRSRSLRDVPSTAKMVTRENNPWSFWTMILLSAVFALAILAFVIAGIYTRLILQS